MQNNTIVNLGDGFSIDLASRRWQEQGFRCFITGMSGSGKTNLVALWMEEAHRIGLQFVAIDPSGDYASLATLGGVAVCGGRGPIRLDYPEVSWLDAVMEAVKGGASMVVELDVDERGRRRNTADRRVIFTWFMDKFLTYQMATRKPILLVIEEAHIFAPQKTHGGQDVAAWDVFKEAAKMGRRSGILLMMASQRPRDLEADIATQCNLTFIGHIEHNLDFQQVKDFLYVPTRNGKRQPPPPRGMRGNTLVTESPGLVDIIDLKAGEFYVRQGKLHKFMVYRRKTKHLGATPALQLGLKL